jgi:hypothetical protein
MRDRWQRDYDRLLDTYGDWQDDAGTEDAYIEVMRNLATSIAWMEVELAATRRKALSEHSDA